MHSFLKNHLISGSSVVVQNCIYTVVVRLEETGLICSCSFHSEGVLFNVNMILHILALCPYPAAVLSTSLCL